MKLPLFIVALMALSACSAAALAKPEAIAAAPGSAAAPAAAEAHRTPTVTCRIELVRAAGSVVLTPKVAGRAGLQGFYELKLRKTGGNSSEVSQGGRFTLDRGGEITLGTNEIGLERGDRLRATLTIRDANDIVCRDDVAI